MGNYLDACMKHFPTSPDGVEVVSSLPETKKGLCTFCFGYSEVLCCRGCGVQAHGRCAGWDEKNPKDFFCEPCRWGYHPRELECHLCGKKLEQNLLMRSTYCGNWVHRICAHWLPGVEDNPAEPYVKLVHPHVNKDEKPCVICKNKSGINPLVLDCHGPDSCPNKFHVTCLFLENPRSSALFGQNYTSKVIENYLFCEDHVHENRKENIICNYPIEEASTILAQNFIFPYYYIENELIITFIKSVKASKLFAGDAGICNVLFSVNQLSDILDCSPPFGLRHKWVINVLLQLCHIGNIGKTKDGILGLDLIHDYKNHGMEFLNHLDLSLSRIILVRGMATINKKNIHQCPVQAETAVRTTSAQIHALRAFLEPVITYRKCNYISTIKFFKERRIVCTACLGYLDEDFEYCRICGIRFHAGKCASKVSQKMHVENSKDAKDYLACHVCFQSMKMMDGIEKRNLKILYEVMHESLCPDPFFQAAPLKPTPLHLAACQKWYEGMSMLLFYTRLCFIAPYVIPNKFAWGESKDGLPKACLKVAQYTSIDEKRERKKLIGSAFDISMDQKDMACIHLLRTTFINCIFENRLIIYELPKNIYRGDDISGGRESMPVPWINEYCDEMFPFHTFSYINRIIEGRGVAFDWQIKKSLKGCSACKKKDGTCSIKCYAHHQKTINLRQECSNACPCYKVSGESHILIDCGLRGSQCGLKYKVEIFKHLSIHNKTKGWGVRAKEEIPKDTFLAVYAGEAISAKTYEEREMGYVTMDSGSYVFNVGSSSTYDWVIDSTIFRNFAAFINHACGKFNLKAVNIAGECGPSTSYNPPGAFGFVTTTVIYPDEELTFNYGTSKNQSFECLCDKCIENRQYYNK